MALRKRPPALLPRPRLPLLFLLLPLLLLLPGVAAAALAYRPYLLSPPTRRSDYASLGNLLADAFDGGGKGGGGASSLADAVWEAGPGRGWASRRYADRYAATCRRMRGMKFGLLLAKDAGGGVTGGGGGRRSRRRRLVPGSVVGMAEVGLSAYPLWGGEGKGEGAGGSTPVLASVGVLAVHPDRRGAGIGSNLLVAAEEAVRRWGPVGGGVGAAEVGEREGGNAPAPAPVPVTVPVLAVHVAVEEGNVSALGFFGGRGYRPVVPDGGGTSESDSDGGGGGGGGRGGGGGAGGRGAGGLMVSVGGPGPGSCTGTSRPQTPAHALCVQAEGQGVP